MSSSVVYILDLKGKVLISRNYRGDLDMGIIDKFMPLVMDREEEGNITPIIQHGPVTFAFIKYNNLYLVSVTKKNANVAMVFQFLHKVVQVWLVISVNQSMFIRPVDHSNSNAKNKAYTYRTVKLKVLFTYE